jgi:hypothetical protein
MVDPCFKRQFLPQWLFANRAAASGPQKRKLPLS